MKKILRSEYVIMFALMFLLSAVTIVFLQIVPDAAKATVTSGFYLSCVAPLLAGFKSKLEKDKLNSKQSKGD